MSLSSVTTCVVATLVLAVACASDDDKVVKPTRAAGSAGYAGNAGAKPSGGQSSAGSDENGGSTTNVVTAGAAGHAGSIAQGASAGNGGTTPLAGSGAVAGTSHSPTPAGATGTSSTGGTTDRAGNTSANVAGAAGQTNSEPSVAFAAAAATICATADALDCAKEASCQAHWETGFVFPACTGTWRAYIDCAAALDAADLSCDRAGDSKPNFEGGGIGCLESLIAHGDCVAKH